MANEFYVAVGGETLLLDASGAAWWPRTRTLLFADLHLEKGSSFARQGQFLPPYDSRATLARMAQLGARFRPERVVALGDSFHDADAPSRLGAEERALLAALVGAVDWIWIAGNHDPAPPSWLGGRVRAALSDGGLSFRHVPSALAQPGEVAGHLHPSARVARWGHSVRRRCFVSDGRRLILPAFGAYAGGLDVGEAPIQALFDGVFHAYLLGRARVYAVVCAQAGRRKITEDSQPRNIAIATADSP